MWFVVLVLVVVLGLMLYAAGQRHATANAEAAFVANERVDIVARLGAMKAIELATNERTDPETIARLTDEQLLEAVHLALEPLGGTRSVMGPIVLKRMLELAHEMREMAQSALAKKMAQQMMSELDDVVDGIVDSLARDAIAHAVRATQGRKKPVELTDWEVIGALDAVMAKEEKERGHTPKADVGDIQARAMKAALRIRDGRPPRGGRRRSD